MGYIKDSQMNLQFPNSPFFLYKLNKTNETNPHQQIVDWDKSIYFMVNVSNFNITEWTYDIGSAETGIMLVESIQNFKTYFSQFKFNSTFNVNVDFTRMYCANISSECEKL